MLKSLLGAIGYVKKSEATALAAAAADAREVAITLKRGFQNAAAEAEQKASEIESTAKAVADKVEQTVRTFKAKKLDELENALKAVPDNVAGFKGYCLALVENDVKLIEVSSKQEALAVIDKARKGLLSLIF